MQLYVLQDGKPTGPFEEAELISRWEKGGVRETDLVWTEGLNEWTPLAKLLSVSNSNLVSPRNDESHLENKAIPNSIEWYKRWQTWAVATATGLVLWLVLAHITTSHPAREQMNEAASTHKAVPTPLPGGEATKATDDWIKQNFPTLPTPQPTASDDRDIRAKQIMNYDKWIKQNSLRPPTVVGNSHSLAFEKGYDVGRLHRARGEPRPSLIQLLSIEEVEGKGFYAGYLKGFNGMSKD
jgi:GYF domain 2